MLDLMTRRCVVVGGPALLLVSARSNAQEPERLFIIYFRWNSAVLMPNMQRRVIEAARAARYHGSAHIEVIGHTDTSMSDTDSMNISVRMAKVVAVELMKHGVASDSITLRGMGENNLAKTTADGVIEPYNRRVEIELH